MMMHDVHMTRLRLKTKTNTNVTQRVGHVKGQNSSKHDLQVAPSISNIGFSLISISRLQSSSHYR